MDTKKILQEHHIVRKKTMNELIADKHKKNQQELNSLRKKWMPESDINKKTP